MIRNWFTCQVKYQTVDQDGQESKKNELYLVNAMTYTEAEARMNFIMSQKASGIFFIDKITKSNYSEVVAHEDSDLWFRVKVSLVTYDDDTEKEKQSSNFMLVQADDVQDGYIKTQEVMKGSLTGYVIPSVSYTKILEVYPHDEDEKVQRDLKEKGFTPVENTDIEEEYPE